MLVINFVPIFDDDDLKSAAEEYRGIWEKDGPNIIQAFRKLTPFSFSEERVGAVVYEWVSFSGRSPRDIMKLRASYSPNVKKATLIHELGHRLLFDVNTDSSDLDHERALFLFLYDVWTEVYEKEFADEQVLNESSRKGLYNYDKAWKWALGLSKEKRVELLEKLANISQSTTKNPPRS